MSSCTTAPGVSAGTTATVNASSADRRQAKEAWRREKAEELTAQPTSDANNPVDGRPPSPTRHDSAFGSAPTSGATLSPAQDLPVVVLIDGDRPLLINHIDGVGVGFEGMP